MHSFVYYIKLDIKIDIKNNQKQLSYGVMLVWNSKIFFREEEAKQTETKNKIAFLTFVEMEISKTWCSLSN